ncbi:MAG: tRNA (cytidine(56)-2'-O)-methyltransferase [Methanoregulaceae archaeon]|jgi:tRNA (cytidine56-2'-O)-methyltransferase|nr:tRNA (cytidine(56)-2'-O)-methyltransferase [Methanoregulaceae archaeon]
MEVVVLRLGHRPERDQRVTTHVGLLSRALGAKGMYLAGQDTGIVRSINRVVEQWGGDFFIEDKVKWRRCIEDWHKSGGKVVHLTMYGLPVREHEIEIRSAEKILVIVGAEKVPGEVYGLSDWNISVTSQPHSEIASLAVFLDRLFEGSELSTEFPGAKIRVVPCGKGKQTESL